MVDQRDQLAREVDDELRREQLLKLWEQYGTYVIAVAALIIVGVGGVKYYQHRSVLAAEAAGARFVAATHQVTESRVEEARKELEAIVASGPGGYAALARLRLAGADGAAGKTIEAATAFEAVAKDSSVDQLLRDYSQLQAAMLRLDTANWTDMQNRLNDLVSEQNPWRYSARELLGLAAYKAGKMDEARQEFQRLIGDRTAPQGIAERARVMMGVIAQAELAKTVPPVEKSGDAAIKSDVKASEPKGKAKTDAKKSK
jgi:hypothetical protein